MIAQETVLVTLVRLVDRVCRCRPHRRSAGGADGDADRLFLKALVIMIVRHRHTVHELLAVVAQPTAEMRALRGLLTLPDGRYPSRRTWDRRLAALPDTLPAQIGRLGHHLVALLRPWAACGRAAASTAPCCAPGAASGTSRTARPGYGCIRRSTPRPEVSPFPRTSSCQGGAVRQQ